MKRGMWAATALGLLAALAVVASVGWRDVARALTALGPWGFALYCALSAPILVLLGAAWWTVSPGARPQRLWTLVWGRAIRDAAGEVLPFSQVGGLVLGARAVVRQGMSAGRVYASSVVDTTTELAAQLLYAVFGLVVLAHRLSWGAAAGRDRGLLELAAGAVAVAFAAGAIVVALQMRGGAAAVWLARRLLPAKDAAAARVQAELAAIHRRPGRMAASVGLHLMGWVAAGLATWAALRLMGASVGVVEVLTIESLVAVIKSFAFALPNAVGVQEGAYALLGPVFGLPAEAAVALSLVKRARDLALGAPTLLASQALEGGRLLRPRPAAG